MKLPEPRNRDALFYLRADCDCAARAIRSARHGYSKSARLASCSARFFFCAVSSFRPEGLLGRQLSDVGLLAQKAITLRFRDDDYADAWNAFD